MPEQQTRVLADRYELIAPLGRGTMGTVWRAHDRSLGREVAIKEIRQEPGLSEAQRTELRERMIREGRTAARISHPSVATVHDAIVEDGSPWIIMELVQARSLEQVIEEEGPLPPRLVAEIGADLLGALRAAHAQGVLHRDVKPGNVLITESGRVVLTDFGIAKAEGDTSLTKTGMVIGSPGYTAPERARGEHNGPESDLWSLGATLYFAVEGRPAYERSTVAETLAALMSEQVDPPTQAGPLRPVLEQLLERDHTARLTAPQASAMLRAVADTPTHLADSLPSTPPPATASPAPAAAGRPATTAPKDTEPLRAEPAGLSGAAGDRDVPADAADAAVVDDGAEDFDSDRTMVVIRPQGGLRIPGAATPAEPAEPSPPTGRASTVGPAAAPGRPAASPYPDRPVFADPGRPVAGRRTSSGPGRPVAGGPGSPGLGAPAAGAPPAPGDRSPGAAEEADVSSSATPPHGFPVASSDPSATPPHGFPAAGPDSGPSTAVLGPPIPGPAGPPPYAPFPPDRAAGAGALPAAPGRPGPAAPQPWRPPGPETGRSPGLGTDLFAFTGQNGYPAPGQPQAPPRKTKVGVFVLMGVAAIALVLIMILVVVAFT
ncbi:serine/threonine-protein kinase [Streptosporangium sp. NPDC023615]|uniref:serine/threonine-protein kinase n=1 Tax=Streptosporangium sp. NPDC023615 TaxID=3154794 RepID=UPI00343F4E06